MYHLYLLWFVFSTLFTFCSSEEAKSTKKVSPDYCFEKKLVLHLTCILVICMLFCIIQQKTLIRQFSNGEERLQKKQPIRNQDDSKFM